MKEITLTSSKPYSVRSLNEWIEDNNLTTYLHISTEYPEVNVPQEYVDVEKKIIVLNISVNACINLNIENKYTTFTSRFNGKSTDISFPTEAIAAIQIKETDMILPLEMQTIEYVENLLGINKKTKKRDRSHLSVKK